MRNRNACCLAAPTSRPTWRLLCSAAWPRIPSDDSPTWTVWTSRWPVVGWKWRPNAMGKPAEQSVALDRAGMMVFRDITFLAAGPASERSRSATGVLMAADFEAFYDAATMGDRK